MSKISVDRSAVGRQVDLNAPGFPNRSFRDKVMAEAAWNMGRDQCSR